MTYVRPIFVLVTGATGKQGGSVVKALLDYGHRVRGLTRTPNSEKAKLLEEEGVDIVKGDFNDPDSKIMLETVEAFLAADEALKDKEIRLLQAKINQVAHRCLQELDPNTFAHSYNDVNYAKISFDDVFFNPYS